MKKTALSLDVLKSRDFRLLLFTRMFSLSALQAQAVIIGWQIFVLTKDPLLLGLTGLAEAAPAIGCALFAGHVVDNARPQRVYLYCLFALLINTLALFIIGSGIVKLDTFSFLTFTYIAIFTSGLARSFIMPSSFSLLAQIIPQKNISAASAWMSTGFQTAAILSPAIAGIVYGRYGAMAAWCMPALLMCAAFFMMTGIHAQTPPLTQKAKEPFVKSIREGWNFIAKTPVLLGAMSLDMLAVLFGGAMALLPAFATDILSVGSQGLGLLRGAPAFGAVIMALILAVRPMQEIRIKTLLWVVTGFGVCMIGFGLSTVFWVSLLMLFLSGAFDSVSMVIRQSLMQLMTPDHMLGRVSSVNSMFIISSNEIGAFESGALAKLVGIVPSVVLGGAGTLLVTGMATWFFPDLRKTVIRPQNDELGEKT